MSLPHYLPPAVPARAAGGALSLLLLSPALAGADTFPTFAYMKVYDGVYQYQVNPQTLEFRPLNPLLVVAGQPGQGASIGLHPSHRTLYMVSHVDSTIRQFALNPTSGQLSLQSTVQAQLLTGAWDICPTGRFLYLTSHGASADLPNVAENSIWTYRIDPDTAALTLMGTVDAGGAGVAGVSLDWFCEFLYVAATASNQVTQFRLQPQTGLPIPLNPSAVFTGTGSAPTTVSLDPDDRFAYTVHSGAGVGWSVGQFSRNAATGQLTPLPRPLAATEANPILLVFDRIGPYVSVLTYNNNISRYRRDAQTGDLTPLNPPRVSTAGHPRALGFDPSGAYAFLGMSFNNHLDVYHVDAQTGQMTSLESPLIPDPRSQPELPRFTDPARWQAQQDMVARAAQDARFQWTPRYGTFGTLYDEHHEWDYRQMDFTVAGGQTLQVVGMVHATSVANPAVRFTRFRLATGELTGWEQVSTP